MPAPTKKKAMMAPKISGDFRRHHRLFLGGCGHCPTPVRRCCAGHRRLRDHAERGRGYACSLYRHVSGYGAIPGAGTIALKQVAAIRDAMLQLELRCHTKPANGLISR